MHNRAKHEPLPGGHTKLRSLIVNHAPAAVGEDPELVGYHADCCKSAAWLSVQRTCTLKAVTCA